MLLEINIEIWTRVAHDLALIYDYPKGTNGLLLDSLQTSVRMTCPHLKACRNVFRTHFRGPK